VTIVGLAALEPRARLTLSIVRPSGERLAVPVVARIDTAEELEYFRHGGILPFVLRRLAAA